MHPPFVTSASPIHLSTSLRLVCAAVVATGLAVLGKGLLNEMQSSPPLRHTYAMGEQRSNPWRGLPGCLRLTSALTGQTAYWPLAQGMGLSCHNTPHPLTPDETPAHAKDIKTALYGLIQPPDSALPTGNTPDTRTLRGKTIAKSADETLTIDPEATSLANQLAKCLTTGNPTACHASQVDPTRFAHLAEGAAVRMLALVDMRLDTGAIETLASAHSPCFEDMVNPFPVGKPPRNTQHCPQFPVQYTRNNAWRSGNHALTEEVMWGSLVKPSLALTLLRSGAIRSEADQTWLKLALKTSDTPAFINRVLCKDKGFPADCPNLAALHSASQDLGYANQTLDLLAAGDGRAHLIGPTTHWLQRPIGTNAQPVVWADMNVRMPDITLLKDCATRNWSVCKGQDLAELTAHLWGQGDGKATALTAAATFARLGAAANQAHARPQPSLRTVVLNQPQPIEPHHAQTIVSGMALTHTGPRVPASNNNGKPGTAHSACIQVWNSVQTCNQIQFLAGKTGTPTFPHDRFTLAERLQHCDAVANRLSQAKSTNTPANSQDKVENARCAYAPTKWYVALVKDSPLPNAPWTRAVAVQVERNWAAAANGGKVDSALDKGINMAAFAAMQYIRLRQAVADPFTPQTHTANEGVTHAITPRS